MRVCAFDGCPEQTTGPYCSEHRRERRSPSSRVTGTYRWRKLKDRLLGTPGWTRCRYCHAEATTLDHRVPVWRGGAMFDERNLVPSCEACNLRKGGRDA